MSPPMTSKPLIPSFCLFSPWKIEVECLNYSGYNKTFVQKRVSEVSTIFEPRKTKTKNFRLKTDNEY